MVSFKIESVNERRKLRGADFIKIEIIEEEESQGMFWYSPQDTLAEIEQYGEESFSNLSLISKILEHEKKGKEEGEELWEMYIELGAQMIR